MDDLIILKIGGNVIDRPLLLDSVLREFSAWRSHRILVHGGGKIASEMLVHLGITPRMVDGRRITDRSTLDVVTMVYAGLINKGVVATLQSLHCNAIGMCGADANLIPAQKRLLGDIDWGFVGDVNPQHISSGVIEQLVTAGYTPVLAPITHDGMGSLLNTNADTIASSMATKLAAIFRIRLVFCFEKRGVLRDPTDETSVIDVLSEARYLHYRENGVITAGMIPKLDNAFQALQSGIAEVHICSPENLMAGTKLVKIL